MSVFAVSGGRAGSLGGDLVAGGAATVGRPVAKVGASAAHMGQNILAFFSHVLSLVWLGFFILFSCFKLRFGSNDALK